MEESEKPADPEGVAGDESGGAPQPAWDVTSTMSLDLGKRFGQLIGRYKVVRVLGEGGMGTVFLAEQDKPTRLVALKVIRPGVASANLLRRFEHEAQVLGRLQHPGIAQIYEAGTADTGEGAQPYFVMEYVRGRSLMEYAQASQLSTRQRLELLVKICDAVQHAHQKGIIHRDLKPGNILVTEEGQPKILDFGVARATDADIQATTIQTDVGQLVGTIPYMSPEQAGGDVTELDTRSDVYALGVLGYELLAGRLPYELKNKMIHEAVRVIREEDPTPLSSIDRVFRGDVETIIAKALQKERTRRYQSASDLAGDIRRYLKNLPILARRPSVAYRLQVFVRRNKSAAVAAVAIALLVVLFVAGGLWAAVVALGLGLAGTSWQYLQATRAKAEATRQRDEAIKARHLAEQREQQAQDARDAESEARTEAQQRQQEAEVARTEAQRQAEIAQTVSDFLTDDLLAAVAPSVEQGKGKDVLMRDVLDEAGKRIEAASIAGGRFEGKPLIEASIRATLGETYRKLGEFAAAEPHLERARLLRRRELGEEHPDTLASMHNLAILYWNQGRHDEAEALCVKTLEMRRHILGEEDPTTLGSMNLLAIVYMDQGRFDEAEQLQLKTLQIKERVLGAEHPTTLASMHNLAIVYVDQGRYDEAEPLHVKTLQIQKRVLGEEHPTTLGSMNGLALLYVDQGRYDDAKALYVKTLEIQKRVLGAEHPNTLASMGNLAGLYQRQGRDDEAERLYVKTLEMTKRVLGEEHPDTLVFMSKLADLYANSARYAEAEPLVVTTLQIQKRALGDVHTDTLASMSTLAGLYRNQRRYDVAEPVYLQTLEIMKRVLGEEHPETLRTTSNLALLYANQDADDEAEPLYVETLEIMKRVLGEEHPDTLWSMSNLANLYGRQGRMNDARPLVRAVQEIQRPRADRPGASARDKNICAWNLLACDPPDLRDPETALRLADEASAMMKHKQPTYLNTLALAQHLMGDTAAAIETEKKALSLLPEGAALKRGEYEAALAKFEAALEDESK